MPGPPYGHPDGSERSYAVFRLYSRLSAIRKNAASLHRSIEPSTRSSSGSLSTENPSPRGVVNVGPANLSHYDNVEFNTVADVTISGGTS